MRADQRLRFQVTNLDLQVIHANEDLGSDRRRTRGIACSVHSDRRVVVDRANALGEVSKRRDRKRSQVGLFLLEHRLNLALGSAVNPGCRPLFLPIQKKGILVLNGFESPTLHCRALRVLDGVLDRSLAIRITHSSRIGSHAVMRQHRCIQAIELGLVQVRLDHSFLEIVENDVLRAPSKITKRLFVKSAPGFGTRLPDHLAKAATRVPQSHHEKSGATVPASAGMQSHRTFAVIHLSLLARKKLQSVELLRIAALQGAHESLHAVVLVREPLLIHQLLVDCVGIALESDLLLDPFAIGFASRTRVLWNGPRIQPN